MACPNVPNKVTFRDMGVNANSGSCEFRFDGRINFYPQPLSRIKRQLRLSEGAGLLLARGTPRSLPDVNCENGIRCQREEMRIG